MSHLIAEGNPYTMTYVIKSRAAAEEGRGARGGEGRVGGERGEGRMGRVGGERGEGGRDG